MQFMSKGRSRSGSLRYQFEQAVRRGTGLCKREWLLENGPQALDQVEGMGKAIVDWCVEEIGTMRRPYGIDQLTIAIASAGPGGALIASTTFGVLRPADFYTASGVGEQVAAFARETIEVAQGVQTVRFGAVQCSWGDIARETIYYDGAQPYGRRGDDTA